MLVTDLPPVEKCPTIGHYRSCGRVVVVTDQWSTEQVAQYLGISINGADRALKRWQISPVGREPGRGGQNLYDAGAVRDAHERRSGQGRRTDLTE